MNDSFRPETPGDVRSIDALPVGSRVAEFEILALLGVGGFGMVYKAFDHSLHRTVAIKEYMPSTIAERADDGALAARTITDRPAFEAGLHSFVDEARMLAQFDHPSLVKVFRFWEEKNTAYMVMPLYHGMTLKQARVHMRAPPSEAWLRKVLWSVLAALRVLHDAKMLHRDISPENIFLQNFGPPVLLDLGASRYAINDNDAKNSVVLKVNYAPVEQFSQSTDTDAVPLQPGPWSDLYSLGAVVHGCLCNDAPLPATLRAVRDRLVPFARVAKTVQTQFGEPYSASFVKAISRALRVQPQDRPQNIAAFLALLEMSMPPAGIEHFNFRAELGNTWIDPTDPANPLDALSVVELANQPLLAREGTVAGALITASGDAEPEQSASHGEPYEGPATVFLEDDRLIAGESPVGTAKPAPVVPAASVASVASVASASVGSVDSGSVGDVVRKATRPKPPTAESESSPAVKRRRAALSEKHASKRMPWLWIALSVLIVAVAGAMGLQDQPTPEPTVVLSPTKTPATGSDNILTELKQPATDTTAAMLDAGATLPAAEALDDASTPEPEEAAPEPEPVRAAAPRPRPKKKVEPPPEPTREPIVVIAPPPPPPPPPPVVVPIRPPPPRALCADSNVLTRSSCLRAVCRTPANRSNPACVEFRKAMEPLEQNQFAN